MFAAVLSATLFVIKCASLATEKAIATEGTGSLLVMCISGGSLIAGMIYGTMKQKLKSISLPAFFLICAAGFFLAAVSGNITLLAIASFILGFGYLAFVPYLQENVSAFGTEGTTVILVFQGLGAFAAPYLGTILEMFTNNLSGQFVATGVIFLILMVLGFFFTKKEQEA